MIVMSMSGTSLHIQRVGQGFIDKPQSLGFCRETFGVDEVVVVIEAIDHPMVALWDVVVAYTKDVHGGYSIKTRIGGTEGRAATVDRSNSWVER
jgi:hypothetical protein